MSSFGNELGVEAAVFVDPHDPALGRAHVSGGLEERRTAVDGAVGSLPIEMTFEDGKVSRDSIALTSLLHGFRKHLLDDWQDTLVCPKAKVAGAPARVAVVGPRENLA